MSENKYVQAMVCFLLISIAVYGWYCIGTKGIYNNGGGAAAVADGIESAKELNNQADTERKKAEAGIAGAEKSADRIEAGLEQAADYNSQLATSIDRCQQTLDGIRKRGKIEAPEN